LHPVRVRHLDKGGQASYHAASAVPTYVTGPGVAPWVEELADNG